MIVTVSQWLAVAVGVWLIGLSLFMLLAPRRALGVLAAMGSTPLIHFGEMAGRIAAGLVLMLASVVSRSAQVITLIGAFLIVSAAVLMVLRRQWHASYSTWWAQRIPVWAVRVSALVSIVAGGVLIWALNPPL